MNFTADEIQQHLTVDGLSLQVFPCLPSTNTLAKQLGYEGAPHGLVIAAEEQTAGRGRMGRSFFSPDGTGIYFSLLLRPTLPPTDSLLITTAAAVAVAQALEALSEKRAEIKWVNDIYMDGKKVCGILTEAAIAPAGDRLLFAVLGIGINLQPPKEGFPSDLQEKAGGIWKDNASHLRGRILAEVLNRFMPIYENLQEKAFIAEYCARSMLDGRPVHVLKGDSTIPATALHITENLALKVRYDNGETEELFTGDVSIRTV